VTGWGVGSCTAPPHLTSMEATMKNAIRRGDPLLWVLLLVSDLLMPAPMYAEIDVMGEIQF